MKALSMIILLAVTLTATAQQWHDKPAAGDNTVYVITPDSPSVAYKKVKDILGSNGYSISRDDAATGTMSTSLKSTTGGKDLRIRVGVSRSGTNTAIRIIGALKPTVLTGYVEGDNSVPVTYTGKIGWEDLLKVAKDYGAQVKYGKTK
jgi:hypothetical protein